MDNQIQAWDITKVFSEWTWNRGSGS